MGALKEEENCTDTNTEKRLCEDTERRWPYTSQGEGVSGKPSSAHTSISDRWLPELRVNSFLLLKPASLWYFIRTALQINTSSLSCFLLFVGFDSRTCCIYSLKCLPPPPPSLAWQPLTHAASPSSRKPVFNCTGRVRCPCLGLPSNPRPVSRVTRSTFDWNPLFLCLSVP